MREPARDKERLENIKEACQIIVEQLKNETLNELTNNPIKFYGYVKLVEIIGEAVYKMTKDFKAEHPNIPWRMMEGMRHVLVHDYYRISPEKLWGTMNSDIPELLPVIEDLLANWNTTE